MKNSEVIEISAGLPVVKECERCHSMTDFLIGYAGAKICEHCAREADIANGIKPVFYVRLK